MPLGPLDAHKLQPSNRSSAVHAGLSRSPEALLNFGIKSAQHYPPPSSRPSIAPAVGHKPAWGALVTTIMVDPSGVGTHFSFFLQFSRTCRVRSAVGHKLALGALVTKIMVLGS